MRAVKIVVFVLFLYAAAAWGWWAEHYVNAMRCPVVGGKDPTEAVKRGLDLRLWIQAALDGGAQRMQAGRMS